ncbi:MAG: hypothetical protein LQ343_004422 [Gyalolechia ehrenbergii]|nr:MAG: hypothetical protein LQ343_004422 [Gyalolechia ehrenbergii]
MARQKSERPKTRHLVRWNDDMDKKLLLTLQWACNKKGVKVPWDMVGAEMGDTITDSAVVQHLAKLRTRMVSEGLPVPPPLTRGGGRSTQVTAPKVTAQRVTKRTVNKKKPVKKTRPDSETDEEYDSEEEVRPAAKKGKKKAVPKSRVKKESSPPGHIDAPNGSESDNDHVFGQQRYAVGDPMWDLNSKTNARAGRSHTDFSQSSRSSSRPTKLVALKIGKGGFAKLGSSIETEGYQSSSYDSRANSVAAGSLKKSASPNSNATMYGMSDSAGSQSSSPREPLYAGDFGEYNEEHADAYSPSASHAHETKFEEYSSHGFPTTDNFGNQGAYGAIDYGQADGSAAGNFNALGPQQSMNTGVNDGLGAPYEPFVNNLNIHGTAPGAGYGADSMSSSASNASFAEAAETSGFADEQNSTVALSDSFHHDHSQFFNDSYYGVNGSDKPPNDFVVEHHGVPTHFPHGLFNAAFGNTNESNQNFEAFGNGRPAPANTDSFSNHTGGTTYPATAADDAGFSGFQPPYSNPHSTAQEFVHAKFYGHEGHNQRMYPQQTGSQTLGSPFVGAFHGGQYAPTQDYGRYGSAEVFDPTVDNIFVFANNVSDVHREPPGTTDASKAHAGQFFPGF